MFTWLLSLYYARLRRLDIEILWPQILKQNPDIIIARWAFAAHASRDPAWLFLPAEEAADIIEELGETNV